MTLTDARPFESLGGIGAVGEDRARLWWLARRTGSHRVEVEGPDGERRGELRADEPGVPLVAWIGDGPSSEPCLDRRPLEPDRDYRVRVFEPGVADPAAVLGFRTAPHELSRTEPLVIAFGSCHQPHDARGRVRPQARAALSGYRRLFRERRVRLFLGLGDQIYTDAPRRGRLVDAGDPPAGDAAEHRRALDRRYRSFWNQPEWLGLITDLPFLPILDDHEVVDNFGSDPRHAGPEWAPFRAAALAAYRDYQASRVVPVDRPDAGPFDFGLHYGPLALFALDLRSERRQGDDARILSAAQWERLEAFLERVGPDQVVAIASSVPLLHTPRWASWLGAAVTFRGDDFSDRWTHPAYQADRERLVAVLEAHARRAPDRPIVMLAGDIHCGAGQVGRCPDGAHITQCVSSPLTNGQGPLVGWLARRSVHVSRRIPLGPPPGGPWIELADLVDEGGERLAPTSRLNVGLLEIVRTDDGPAVRFELHAYDDGEVRRVFRSRPLPAARGADTP